MAGRREAIENEQIAAWHSRYQENLQQRIVDRISNYKSCRKNVCSSFLRRARAGEVLVGSRLHQLATASLRWIVQRNG